MVAMVNQKQIACVTGASGMIGSRIVEKLLVLGYHVRVLTRRPYSHPDVEVFCAGLSDLAILDAFVSNANLIFHCAAELRDESIMQSVNVQGAKQISQLVARHGIQYFCHLSSAGVIGKTNSKWVDELTPCDPQNPYERTKYEAEGFVSRAIHGCSTVILRPTNVIDETHLGELRLPVSGTLKSKLIAFFKGAECAHIVHAEDVADAAIFFITRPSLTPRTFFVSIDNDPLNTVANLWPLWNLEVSGRNSGTFKPLFHLPMLIPFLIRSVFGRSGNLGDVRYSSDKLKAEGFVYKFDVRSAVRRILLDRTRLVNNGSVS